MATVSGNVAITLNVSPTNSDLKFQNAFTRVEVGNVSGSLPSGAKVTGASLRFTSIAVWHTGLYFKVVYNSDRDNVIGQTDSLSYQTAEFLKANLSSYNANNIISAASSNNLWLRFYGGNNTQNALNLKSSSVTLVIDYEYEESTQYSASTGSLDKSSVTADGSDTITLSINGNTNALNHKAIWRFGSYSSTSTVNTGSNSATLTPPIEWCNAVPKLTSGTATVELQTYYGSTLIGTASSYSFTVNVPSSVVPTFNDPTYIIGGTSLNGRLIQGKSKITITAGNASGAYGSTITQYAISGANLSYTGTGNSATSDVLQNSGSLTYTVTVTDSRGRSASKQLTVTVYPYSSPSITNYSAYRSNTSGTPSETGTSILCYCECYCSSIDGQNAVKWAWDYKLKSASSWTSGAKDLNSGANSRADGKATVGQSYEIRITATDSIGGSAYVTLELQTAGTVMFFKKGGNGIGIGAKTSKSDAKTFEVASDWAMYHGDYKIPTYIVSATAPPVVAGLIWLKPVEE